MNGFIYKVLRRVRADYQQHTVNEITSHLGGFGGGAELCYPALIQGEESVFIGENSHILRNSRIQVYNYLTGLNSKITIGNDCYLGSNLTLLAGGDITIEDNVLMASDILITSENHGVKDPEHVRYMDSDLECKPVRIGEGAWLGQKVMVLPGVTIGKRAIIGAGAVVTHDVPDYAIAVGNPAKVIKKYNCETEQWEK